MDEVLKIFSTWARKVDQVDCSKKNNLLEAYKNAEIARMQILNMILYPPDNDQTALKKS